jgi:hypothetical protein
VLSTGEWITIICCVASVAVLWGKHQAQIAALAAGLRETRSSDTRQGERMGGIESRLAAFEAVDKERVRTRTGAIPIGPTERNPHP